MNVTLRERDNLFTRVGVLLLLLPPFFSFLSFEKVKLNKKRRRRKGPFSFVSDEKKMKLKRGRNLLGPVREQERPDYGQYETQRAAA